MNAHFPQNELARAEAYNLGRRLVNYCMYLIPSNISNTLNLRNLMIVDLASIKFSDSILSVVTNY